VAAESPKKRSTGQPMNSTVAGFNCALLQRLIVHPKHHFSNFYALLGAANSDIANYAISIFLQTPENELSVTEILENIAPVFRNRDKEPMLLALKLLSRLALLFEERNSDIGVVIVKAFESKSKAVHQSAIDILTKQEFYKLEEVQAQLEKNLDLLVGSNRSAVSKLLSQATPTAVAQRNQVATILVPEIPSHLNHEYCSLAGLTTLRNGCLSGSTNQIVSAVLHPVDLYSAAVPRLYESEKLAPVNNIDDLIYLAAAGINKRLSTIDFELLLDGISRMGHLRPEGFEAKTENLRQLTSPLDNVAAFAVETTEPLLATYAWLRLRPASYLMIKSARSLKFSRVFGLCARLVAGLSLPMLAAPTHKSGWIDPQVLVERVKKYQQKGRLLSYTKKVSVWSDVRKTSDWISNPIENAFNADATEFVQSLLRLAPDGRSTALELASDIQGDFGNALRFALGKGELCDIKSPELALSAFRSRFPFDTAPPDSIAIHAHFPDGTQPAEYHFRPDVVEKELEDRYNMIRRNLSSFLDTTVSNTTESPREDWLGRQQEYDSFELLPTVAVHGNTGPIWSPSDLSLAWLQNREPLLAQMSRVTLVYIKSIGAYWRQDYSLLFDVDFPLHKNGCWWLTIALASHGDDLQRMALDILIAAIDENRTDPDRLGESMAALSKLTSTKFTLALRELSRVSALHALASWRIAMSFLANASGKINLAFLELALELYEEHGFLPTVKAIDMFSKASGTGKAARIAKQLAALSSEGPASLSLQKAVDLSLASRVARIERWQKSTYYSKTH